MMSLGEPLLKPMRKIPADIPVPSKPVFDRKLILQYEGGISIHALTAIDIPFFILLLVLLSDLQRNLARDVSGEILSTIREGGIEEDEQS